MINIYKEKGYTSSDVVARLRGILHMRKIGHTGTLDPDAEGVLPVCLGSATKIVDLIADRDKEYEAVMRLGVTTDTQDMSGTVLERAEEARMGILLSEDRIREVCRDFTGNIMQIPPMYSAVKVNGKRLYQLARQGRTVERQPRPVTIHELEIKAIELPLVTMRVRCSKGTYIRTLCHDIGQALGTGAAMEKLLRTRVGSFLLRDAITLDEAESIARGEDDGRRIEDYILPVDSFFDGLARVSVRKAGMRYLMNGNRISLSLTSARREEIPDGGIVRVYDENGRFCALYRYSAKQEQFTGYKMFLPQ